MSTLKMPLLSWDDFSPANQVISAQLGAATTLYISGGPPPMGLLIGQEPPEMPGQPAPEPGYRVSVNVSTGNYRNFGPHIMNLDEAKRAAWLLGLDQLVKTLQTFGPAEVREDVARVGLTIERELEALRAAWSMGSKAGGSTP